MQEAHWLEGTKTFEARRQHENEGDRELEYAVVDSALRNPRQNRGPAGESETAKPPQQNQRANDAQPLVPVPAQQKIKIAGGFGLSPGIVSGFEDPLQRKRHYRRRGCETRLGFSLLLPTEKDAVGNSKRGHVQMQREGCQEQPASQQIAAVEHGYNRGQDQRGGQRTWLQVLIG